MSLRSTFIVGAAKSGTTALYYLLTQHPNVCCPIVKEPNYFSNIGSEDDVVHPGTGPGDAGTAWTESLKQYHELFNCNERHCCKLDASVSYLYSTSAARCIADYCPEARVIIVLRNPADRAWSHYKHLVRDGRECLSFEDALRCEEERIQNGWEFSWHLKQMGLYSHQIFRYYKTFGRRQVKIFLFDDLKLDIEKVVKEATAFMRLPDYTYNFNQTRHNASGISRSRTLSEAANWLAGHKVTINKVVPPNITHGLMQVFRSLNTKQEELSIRKKTRRTLLAYFKDDILKTSQLIGRDLSLWLN